MTLSYYDLVLVEAMINQEKLLNSNLVGLAWRESGVKSTPFTKYTI